MGEHGIQLIEPAEEFRQEFGELMGEFRAVGEIDLTPGLCCKDEEGFDAYIRRMRDYARGENLPDGWVQNSAYWLVSGGRICGVCDLRHSLTEALRDFGGHAGYSVRPSERNKGYGTLMVKLVLQKASRFGIDRALITCSDQNIASQRVILKNGGVLDSESYSEHGKRITQRYWIDLEPGAGTQ